MNFYLMLLVILQNFSCRIFPTPFKMNNLADVCLVVIAIFKLRTNFLHAFENDNIFVYENKT